MAPRQRPRTIPPGRLSVGGGPCTVQVVHTLYLLRHAKSSWSDPRLADHERPLSPRGRRDAKRIADHLLQLGIAPALVLCSDSRRTRETLQLVRPALDAATVSLESELYAASPETLLERLHAVPEEVASVMLIGHNPGLEHLALLLASDGPELGRLETKFPTAALATLTLATAMWQRLSEADAVLAAYVVPKELG
jgi:phosphohistidine phosphatase